MQVDKKAKELKRLLKQSKRCAIIAHTNPDGDAVGSSMAFWHYLKSAYKNIDVKVIYPTIYPDFLTWVANVNESLIYIDKKDEVKKYLSQSDLIICVDFNTLSRIDELGEYVKSLTVPKVLIDHHLDPSDEFDLVFSDITMSSTCEYVYRVITAMGGKKNISVDAAEALYLGIMTDTGSFNYSVRTPATFRIAADLMEIGADKECVASRVFNGYSEERLRLLGYSLKDKMKIIPQKNAAYIALSQEELKSYNFEPGDTEGFVNYPLSIKNICVSALFTESMDKSIIRVSLRSKGKEISVNDFSRKYFNGGGHFNAAGGKYLKSLEECCAYFEQVVMEQDW